MSEGLDPEDFAQFMDIAGLWGEVSAFPCDHTDGDWVQLRRVGTEGGEAAVVSVQMLNVDEPDYVEVDEEIEGHFATSVLLSPSNARRMAIALIEAADEADGNFTNLIGGGNLEID